ncbi:acyltransferase domain-containing protein [Streptomyces qinzhouensis]|uniref:Acyltransferase domain-containing protein n=1 Tax=Streptomyces qinzhouensis TaxID=2599401 RepID=A0A5B8JC76_9ACTN|nr:acyltransferase domain-containing protein [Streptomyces qinzhouensis]QDY75230.1 acyltransferase domain-containing protein [Streptomyces qinzhouensis]
MAVTVAVHDTARLLCWAGTDPADERAARARLARALRTGTALPVPGAVAGPWRGAVVTTPGRALADLAAAPARQVPAQGPRPVALLLPGQGSQHHRMASGLYREEPVFRAAVDHILELWGAEGEAIRADWLDTGTGPGPRIPLDDGRRSQPLLFTIDHALGRLLMSWGITPAEVLGHSAGEIAAATLAGVFTTAEAVTLIRDRVRAAARVPAGGMLTVAASPGELGPYLSGQVTVAAVNAPRRTMLAGPHPELAATAARLTHAGLMWRPVPATSPFHSPAMEPAATTTEKSFHAHPGPARIPVRSGYTSRLLTPEETHSPRFWARQMTDTVHFGPALTELLNSGDRFLIECGPGRVLASLATRQPTVHTGNSTVMSLLPGDRPDHTAVLETAAALWREGHHPTPHNHP